MVPADSDRIPRAPPYSGASPDTRLLPVRGFHPLRPDFPDGSGSTRICLREVLQPRRVLERSGLGSSLFARHYWGNRCFFLLLRVLRCFSSPGSPRHIDGTGSSIQWVAPFGHVRIKPCLRVPGLFRSLPRPSSPAEAKASSMRPNFSFSK